MTPQQAVEAPRFATFSFPNSFYPHGEPEGQLNVEGAHPAGGTDELAARGHDVILWPEFEFDAGGVSLALDLVEPRDGRPRARRCSRSTSEHIRIREVTRCLVVFEET